MATALAPWQCPQCFSWMAPAVSEHRCDQGSAGSPARLIPVAPLPPSGGVVVIPAGYVRITEPGEAPSLRLLSQHEKPGDPPHRKPGLYSLESEPVVLIPSGVVG